MKDLLGRYTSDIYRSDNPSGYQRQVTRACGRCQRICAPRKDVAHVHRPLHPSPHRAQFEPVGTETGGGESGLLTISPDVRLWVVDGQHRLSGERALKKDKAKWVSDYPLPVVIVEGIDQYEEMRYFHVINTRHKGVPTDVVDRHLLSMREAEGVGLIEREGEKGYQRARATKLTDVLNNDPASPWRGMIRIPGEPLRPEHTMRQHSMVSSLDPVVNDGLIRRVTDEEAAKLLLNYWNAAKALWGSAFEEPREYVIQKSLGAGALHQIFSDVIELCRAADDYSTEKMNDSLSYVGRSAGFWHSVRGHHMVRQSGVRYVRALAEYLRERLPRPVLRRL